MSSISHVCEEGSIVSKLRASILLRCRVKVMFSRFVSKCLGIPVVFYFT